MSAAGQDRFLNRRGRKREERFARFLQIVDLKADVMEAFASVAQPLGEDRGAVVVLTQQLDLYVAPISDRCRTVIFDPLSPVDHILKRNMLEMEEGADPHRARPEFDGCIEIGGHEGKLTDRAETAGDGRVDAWEHPLCYHFALNVTPYSRGGA